MGLTAANSMIVRDNPVVVEFSLWQPNVTANNYANVEHQVLRPIFQFFCANGLYLVENYAGGDICTLAEDEPSHRYYDGSYGGSDHSVLQRGEIKQVQDREIGKDDKFTSWEVEFDILQIGHHLHNQAKMNMDMGSSKVETGPVDIGMDSNFEKAIVDTMANVVQLAFEVSVMEGMIDEGLETSVIYPAYVSLPGKEVETWQELGILSNSTRINIGRTSSIVGGALSRNHGLKYFGIAWCLTICSVAVILHKLGRWRRHTRYDRTIAEQSRQDDGTTPIRFRTESEMNNVLNIGRNDMIRKWRNGRDKYSHMSADGLLLVPIQV